jgi:glyoxylase I family protein
VPATGVHHVDLVVTSLEHSLPWYRDLLAPLGYGRVSEIVGERGERVCYLGGRAAIEVGLRESLQEGEHDRYRVGLHHLAFEAPSRDAVDERHAWLVSHGSEIENEPREYDYVPGYYATFFYDPDGLKLEILHVPDSEGAQ